jgi:hypothetical protein
MSAIKKGGNKLKTRARTELTPVNKKNKFK